MGFIPHFSHSYSLRFPNCAWGGTVDLVGPMWWGVVVRSSSGLDVLVGSE